MIETALYVAVQGQWLTASDVMRTFADVAGLQTLQVQAVVDGLSRLAEKGRADVRRVPQYAYKLSTSATQELEREFRDSSARFDRVLHRLYDDAIPQNQVLSLAPFFIELMCEFFSHLGTQWAKYLAGEHFHAPLALEVIEKIIPKKLEKFGVRESCRPDLTRRTLGFFQQRDPDYDYLKFSLGQSFYVARLLGMEGKDYLSKEIFADKTLYLDSSVVIPALLGSSRHYEVFRDLQRVCKALHITLCVARPTVDEVRNVAAAQEQIGPTVYDQVPASLGARVRGDFFQTYRVLKTTKPDATPDEVFRPFHNLAETIESVLGAEIIDDESFAKIPYSRDFATLKQAFQEASQAIRRTPKFNNALSHDAVVFSFLASGAETSPDQTWIVTRDLSLPTAWSKLQPNGVKIRAFLLDGLLQCISPFILEENVKNFSELFSDAITAQLLPQTRIFDIDDFLLFQDIEVDCNQLTDEEVQEGLLRVKQHVLHGASYRHEDLGPAAYELRRFFTKRTERHDSLTAEKHRLESVIASMKTAIDAANQRHSSEIADLEAKHAADLNILQQRLSQMEQRENDAALKTRDWLTLAKKVFSLLGLGGIQWWLCRLALKYGAGQNAWMRLGSFSPFFLIGFGVWLILIKKVFFRRERLKDVFSSWAEIKELMP